jgi:AcrR family transcriptional regulator
MDCVRARGPQVSVDELARAAGVSKPVLYDLFGSRRGLAVAVADELADLVERELVEAIDPSRPPAPAWVIRSFVTAVLRIAGDDKHLYRFTVQSLRASDQSLLDNPLAARLRERASAFIDLASPTIDGVTASILLDGLFGFLLGATESWLSSGEPIPSTTLVDRLADALFAAWSMAFAG